LAAAAAAAAPPPPSSTRTRRAAAATCKVGKGQLSGTKCSSLTGCNVCQPNAKNAKQLDCVCCNGGYVLPKGATKCTACKIGTFSTPGAASCIPCAAGVTNLKAGMGACDGAGSGHPAQCIQQQARPIE
jgi:hypothetical protein